MAEPQLPHRNGVSDSLKAACIEQIGAATNVLRLIEEQKRTEEEALGKIQELEKQLSLKDRLQRKEKEEASKRILELERKLDTQQKLEKENDELKRKLLLKKQPKDKDIAEIENTVTELKMVLAEKEEEMEDLERSNQMLIFKERQSNDELQEARKELIAGFPQSSRNIRIRRMGEIEFKPFENKFKDRCEAAKLCTLWQERLTDSNWHPLKVVDINGIPQEIIDEDDEMLRNLKEEWGDEIWKAVISAYRELNEYNPSIRA